uniref:RING-type domain-containing protein n=1 Tax=Heterorhabditis bacteriophora TaxID=37862 RepID=A0A1I7XRQ7_HETBA
MVFFYEAEQCVDADGWSGRCYQLGRSHEKLQLVAIGEHLALLTKQHALIPSVYYFLFLIKYLTKRHVFILVIIYGVMKVLLFFRSNETEFMSMVTVYNVKGQYIGFSCCLPSLCRYMLKFKIMNYLLNLFFHQNIVFQYLDGTRLVQLCIYLEALHDSGKHNSYHTNILLNCYARLDERKKMIKFVEKISASGKADMHIAFQVLRASNMSAEASILATKLHMHEEALSAMIEDLNKYSTAIKYISKRTPFESDADCESMILPFIEDENSQRALRLAQLFGCFPAIQYILNKTEHQSDTWIDALVFVSNMTKTVDDTLIKSLLAGIEASDCVHPLVVLDILSRSNTLKMSVVKEYVVKQISKQEKQIQMDHRTIAESERRMEEIEKHIESLKFNVQVLQINKCCACDTSLQLPAVHFLCRHSYHVHCFESYSERPDKCPACISLNSRICSHDDLNERLLYQKFQYESSSISPAISYKKTDLFRNDDDIDESNPFLKRSMSSVSSSSSRLTSSFALKSVRIIEASNYDKTKNPFCQSSNSSDES